MSFGVGRARRGRGGLEAGRASQAPSLCFLLAWTVPGAHFPDPLLDPLLLCDSALGLGHTDSARLPPGAPSGGAARTWLSPPLVQTLSWDEPVLWAHLAELRKSFRGGPQGQLSLLPCPFGQETLV